MSLLSELTLLSLLRLSHPSGKKITFTLLSPSPLLSEALLSIPQGSLAVLFFESDVIALLPFRDYVAVFTSRLCLKYRPKV